MLPDQWSVVVDECARGCSQQVKWSLASADRRTTASSPQQTAAAQPTQLTLGWVYCKSSIFLYFVWFISLFKKVAGLLLLCPSSWLCGELRRKLKGKVCGEGIWWREKWGGRPHGECVFYPSVWISLCGVYDAFYGVRRRCHRTISVQSSLTPRPITILLISEPVTII